MAHNQGNYTIDKMVHPDGNNPSYPSAAMGTAARRLFLSDNPETVNSVDANGSVLYADSSRLANGMKKYRVVLWHTNATGKQIRLALTLENEGSHSMTFSNCSRELDYRNVNDDLLTLGMNNAKACLGATMDSFTPVDSTINPGNTGIIFAAAYDSNKHFGAIYEFTVNGTGSESFTLRTLAITAGSNTATDYSKIRSVKSEIVYTDTPHPRGAWDTYELNANGDIFTISATTKEKLYVISAGKDGHDNVFTAPENSPAIDNIGHYGVNYNLSIPLKNNTGSSKKIGVYIDPRAATYAGACKYNNVIKGIPVLHYHFSGTMDEVVKIDTITLAANSSKNLALTLMHACGATLAVGVYLKIE